MVGELDRSGIGIPTTCDSIPSVNNLWGGRVHSNELLRQQLREDENATELLRLANEDAKLGRMSKPRLWEQSDTDKLLVCPRFGVEQDKPDGGKKVRATDNFSWSTGEMYANAKLKQCGDIYASAPVDSQKSSRKKQVKKGSVSGHTAPSEKLSHDTLDELAEAMGMFVDQVGEVPGLFKAWHGHTVPCVIYWVCRLCFC